MNLLDLPGLLYVAISGSTRSKEYFEIRILLYLCDSSLIAFPIPALEAWLLSSSRKRSYRFHFARSLFEVDPEDGGEHVWVTTPVLNNSERSFDSLFPRFVLSFSVMMVLNRFRS